MCLISCQGIRIYVFDESVLEKDASDEPEAPPKKLSTLSGLGSSAKAGGGKYDGFGNSPINKGSPIRTSQLADLKS